MLRTRMSDFGHNYKGGRNQILCPLCGHHEDKQSFLLTCPEIKKELDFKFGTDTAVSIDDIYKETIHKMTVNVVRYAMETRSKKLQDAN